MRLLRFLTRLRWGRMLLTVVTSIGVLAAPAVGGVVAAFQVIELPAQVRKNQASVLYYSDGVTELTRVGVENRTYAPLSEVPLPVRHAVLAAEDRGYYQHGALSWTGVVRAMISNATSDDTQGASTITQQFVKNAYLGQERTLDRKAREAVLAIKAERRYSKDQILEGVSAALVKRFKPPGPPVPFPLPVAR